MLDVMRRANTKKWFLYALILPVVFSFVLAIFAIWGGAADTGAIRGEQTWLARVNGIEITLFDLERHRRQLEAQFRQQNPEAFDQIAKMYNFEQMALSQLVGQALAYSEAQRLGLEPGDDQIAEAIVRAPIFQRNGRFIGREAYLEELRRTGYDPAQYEHEIARELAIEKLRAVMGTMVAVSESDVEEAYRERGETAEVDYVVVKESTFPAGSEPSAREVEAHYRDNPSSYTTGEKRRAAVVLIEREPLLKAVEVPENEIQENYDKNRETLYRRPEQRRASHVLLKVAAGASEADVEAVRARAQGLLERIRAGADFAQVARESSEDPSAATGGDLDWFGRGRMVPEFEQAAWSLSEDQVSDLVKTQFGFHIIKLTGSREAGVEPLDAVRDRIRNQLAFSRAQELLSKKADEFIMKTAQQASSFESNAAELGYPVKDTGLVARGDPMGELGVSPMASEELFRLKPGETSGQIRVAQGIAILKLAEVKAPEPAPFETVKDRVKADLVKARAMEKARAAARKVAAAGVEGFKAAADAAGLTVQSTGEFTRASAPADFSDPIKEAVFSHRANDLLGPLDGKDGAVVVRVIKRGPEGPEAIQRARDDLRQSLVQERRGDAFGALLQRLQKSAAMEQNQAAFAELSRRAGR